MLHPSQFLALLILTTLALFTLFLRATLDTDLWGSRSRPGLRHPDFSRYIDFRVLEPDEFPTDDPRRRVIILGDIHGMKKPLQRLLDTVAYDHHNDVLVHTGDVFVREHLDGPLEVIDFLTRYNITGVRGNHDQKLVEWKGWLNWFETLPGGEIWLSNLESQWQHDSWDGQDLKEWVERQRRESRGEDARWWSLIPDDWTPFSMHYNVAQALTEQQYAYLLSLPLKLHIPSAHAFVIHAGLLPYDVRHDCHDPRQPLARVPHIRAYTPPYSEKEIEILRSLQELKILTRVPQNTDPWVNLNMRSILESNEVTRNWKEGTPWADYWNDQMTMCDGFHDHVLQTQDLELQPTFGHKTLPCYPSSVIYGHSAGRGLDVNRWSFGLDTGCAYGRELTALILGPNPLPNEPFVGEEDDRGDIDDDWINLDDILDDFELEERRVTKHRRPVRKARTIKFGEHGTAKLVQIPCS